MQEFRNDRQDDSRPRVSFVPVGPMSRSSFDWYHLLLRWAAPAGTAFSEGSDLGDLPPAYMPSAEQGSGQHRHDGVLTD